MKLSPDDVEHLIEALDYLDLSPALVKIRKRLQASYQQHQRHLQQLEPKPEPTYAEVQEHFQYLKSDITNLKEKSWLGMAVRSHAVHLLQIRYPHMKQDKLVELVAEYFKVWWHKVEDGTR